MNEFFPRKEPKKVKVPIILFDDQVDRVEDVLAYCHETYPNIELTRDRLYQNLIEYALDRKSTPHLEQLLKEVKTWLKEKAKKAPVQEAKPSTEVPNLNIDKQALIEKEKARRENAGKTSA